MTPEQEEEVRRALAAAARADEPLPMPPEVVTRLTDVLEGLVRDRQPTAGAQPTGELDPAGHLHEPEDELAPRRDLRRARRRPAALVAAAAVVAAGLVGSAVATDGFGLGTGSSSTTAGGTASRTENAPTPGSAATGPQQATGTDGAAGVPTPGSGSSGSVRTFGRPSPAVPRLRTATLTRDLRLLVAGTAAGPRAAAPGPAAGPGAGPDCARPAVQPGDRRVPVLLDGRPATVLLGPVRAGSRTARVFSCADGATPLTRVTLPAG